MMAAWQMSVGTVCGALVYKLLIHVKIFMYNIVLIKQDNSFTMLSAILTKVLSKFIILFLSI